MKKRFISALLIFAMAGSLTACGGKSSGDDSKSDSDEKGVTIEYWHINSETQGGPIVEELIKTFNETNDQGITVVGKFNSDAYAGVAQNLQAELAIGEYPGVVQVGWNYLNYFAENFHNSLSNTNI